MTAPNMPGINAGVASASPVHPRAMGSKAILFATRSYGDEKNIGHALVRCASRFVNLWRHCFRPICASGSDAVRANFHKRYGEQVIR